ncbi:circadian clock KaiB family protein [Gloeocapsopsis sp. IPPAS B-1203]|uniref:circadian clock KaiB family protein n=1 Tax=Gloeocapsopsis sp. IPPAS B-1203 TaxID=2049454 RepID=UPI000C19BFA5|nr:circadian clock KaiB family protein [Gloeocapsopsis sp. IPPAS B-1203]PIG95222.1 circadian clock protein KaiB [Gloeocapsopsis sp. IPPAS B-1203]
MNQAQSQDIDTFKGIALFTPGGDLIYCIDPKKQGRWHSHLCAGLQEILNLPELPHFLVPCYTATIDRWLDPQTQQVQTYAEAHPPVLRYQPLLNAVFRTHVVWQAAPVTEGLCDPILLATYRPSFPQLWEEHELVVHFERSLASSRFIEPVSSQPSIKYNSQPLDCTLYLFVAGHNPATERILQTLRQVLEQFNYPYTLKVIDVLKYPEQAEIYQVTATPTLVKVSPKPTRRLVGNLDNAEKLLQMLTFPEI